MRLDAHRTDSDDDLLMVRFKVHPAEVEEGGMPQVRPRGPLPCPGEGRLVLRRGPADGAEAEPQAVRGRADLGVRVPEVLALGGPGVQVVARRDGVLRRVGLRGPPVAVGGQRVVLPVVVAQQVLHAGHVGGIANVAGEDLRTGVARVGIRITEALLHVICPRDHPNLREEGRVVGDPKALRPQHFGEIRPHDASRHLLRHREEAIRQVLVGLEAMHLGDHPLVIDGARVEGREPLHPAGAVGGLAVGDDCAGPGEEALRLDLLQRGLVVHRVGGLLYGQSGAQHVEVVATVEVAKVGGVGNLICAAQGQVVLLQHPKH
mmetsp:Transcript_17718/g.42095  ORF Transcript_17718/g.42095 Transcript_17718/m.42095 type:complete len:319 (+) Transcript_17718:55-1011(+)